MSENCGADATPPAASLWAAEQSALVRGLAHALSNRVGTVAAASGMLAPDMPAPAPVVEMLADEAARLEELLGMLRLLGGEEGADEPEPLHLPDLVGPVVALHAHHPELRDVPCEVTADAEAPPVRARRDGLTRALLVLLSAAKQEASGVRIRWRREGAIVALSVEGATGVPNVADDATQLAGAPVRAAAEGYVVELAPL